MAELHVEDGELVLHLSRAEKLESVHGDPRAPLSAVRSVQVLDNAHEPADHGFKVGTRIPGVSEVAVLHTDGQKIFAVVHHDTPRGVRIDFNGTDFDTWIIGTPEPEALKTLIESQ